MAKKRDSMPINPLFSRGSEMSEHPRFKLAASEMLPETAYQIVHDEAMLDGNARLNLATFVGTWMERPAIELYAETFDKNMIDKDEYPATAAIEERCWRILADCGTRPTPRGRSGPRRSAHPRPACSAAWRSSAAGSSPDGRPASPPSRPTSS